MKVLKIECSALQKECTQIESQVYGYACMHYSVHVMCKVNVFHTNAHVHTCMLNIVHEVCISIRILYMHMYWCVHVPVFHWIDRCAKKTDLCSLVPALSCNRRDCVCPEQTFFSSSSSSCGLASPGTPVCERSHSHSRDQ